MANECRHASLPFLERIKKGSPARSLSFRLVNMTTAANYSDSTHKNLINHNISAIVLRPRNDKNTKWIRGETKREKDNLISSV